MTTETDITALKDQVNALLTNVNAQKTSVALSVDLAINQQSAAESNAAILTATSVSVATSATAASNNATSATTAKNLALAAWASAATPIESYASSLSSLHAGIPVRSIIYDTSQDYDGGAWRKRCQDKSWYSETLGGTKWLGQKATAAAAWATSDAVSGNYFQNSADTKFYQLGSVSPNVTEVFRGNVREFPSAVAIVLENSRVIIYDLTQPGCPMWMVIKANQGSFWTTFGMIPSASVFSVAALNGLLCLGSLSSAAAGCLYKISFVADECIAVVSSDYYMGKWGGVIAERHTYIAGSYCDGNKNHKYGTIVSRGINEIAVSVLPNAPIDPATDLPFPTIAVATAGGVSIIKQDGSIEHYYESSWANNRTASSIKFSNLTLTWSSVNSYSNTIFGAQQYGVVQLPITLIGSGGTTSLATQSYFNDAPYRIDANVTSKILESSEKTPNLTIGRGEGLYMVHGDHNSSKTVRTRIGEMYAIVTNRFNSGWQLPDSRLCALTDTTVGSITSPNLMTNGDFSNGVTGWTIGSGGNAATTAVSNGEVIVTSSGNNYGAIYQLVPVTIGKTYLLTAIARKITTSAGWVISNNNGSATNNLIASTTNSLTGSCFTATASSVSVLLQCNNTDGFAAAFSNVSLTEVVADCSYYRNGLVVSGTLTKVAAAVNAQLVAYSGWSTSNYLTQPYCWPLEFGITEWDAGAWINVSASSAAIAAAIAAAGGLGVELALPTSATAGWGTTTSTLSSDGVSLRVTNSTAAEGYANGSTGLVIGKTYLVSLRTSASSGPSGAISIGGVRQNLSGGLGVKTYQITATTTGAIRVSTNSAALNDWVEVNSLSVREVTGTLPIFERSSLRNLLTYSQDFSTWVKTNISQSGSLITRTANLAANMQSGAISYPIGSVMTVAAKVSAASVGGFFALRAQGSYPHRIDAMINLSTGAVYSATNVFTNLVVSAVSDGSGSYLLSASFTVASSRLIRLYFGPAEGFSTGWEGASPVASNCNLYALGLLQGAYSAAQIQVMGGIPLTTTVPTVAAASFSLGLDASGNLRGTVSDGTTTRTATSPLAVNTGLPTLTSMSYRTNGNLELTVNDSIASTTSGAPLLTLTNGKAVLTVGNDLTHQSPFPGSIAMLAVSGVVPSMNQRNHIYRTELAMMQNNAKCTVDGYTQNIEAISYDEHTDVLHVGTSWGRSAFKDLVRIESEVTTSGAIVSLSANRGTVITTGTSVNIYKPSLQLREELKRKDEAKKLLGQVPIYFDFDAITDQTAFLVPTGYTTKAVYSNSYLKRLGSTKDYTVSNDGFQETVNFGTAPGNAVFVSIMATRSI